MQKCQGLAPNHDARSYENPTKVHTKNTGKTSGDGLLVYQGSEIDKGFRAVLVELALPGCRGVTNDLGVPNSAHFVRALGHRNESRGRGGLRQPP
jgi:hypothetical protein